MELRCSGILNEGLPLDSRSNLHYGMADSAEDGNLFGGDGDSSDSCDSVECSLPVAAAASAAVASAAAVATVDNKEESVLGAALAQAPTTRERVGVDT